MNYKIIFYDGDCPLCNRAVRFILREDRQKQFHFAPLNGQTAEKELKDLRLKHPSLDTLVLLEKGKKWIEGKAALRILWLIGGKWALIGWLSFLPSPLFDFFYRIIARNRYKLFSGFKPIDTNVKDRFLP